MRLVAANHVDFLLSKYIKNNWKFRTKPSVMPQLPLLAAHPANEIALASAACGVRSVDFKWVNMSVYNFFVNRPKFIKSFHQMWEGL